MTDSQPSAAPPVAIAAGAPDMTMSLTEGASEYGVTVPTLRPPEPETPKRGIGVWQNDKRITGLWGTNETRNAWVLIAGIGWKKLRNNSDSALLALTVLSAHAKQAGSPVNYREEADGMIYELYVF